MVAARKIPLQRRFKSMGLFKYLDLIFLSLRHLHSGRVLDLMDISFEVSDPTDWLQTSLCQVAPVEAALRCQVCKDFFDTPMITSCSHTFCSLCIRRCLTNDGKCPTCRAADQELRLRRNWTVEEVVQTFKEARPALLQLNDSLAAEKEEKSVSIGKRKREEVGDQDTTPDETYRNTKRKTRSQSQRDSSNQAAIKDFVADSEGDDDDYQPGTLYFKSCNFFTNFPRRRFDSMSNLL